MNKNLSTIIKLVKKYKLPHIIEPDADSWISQYEGYSACINYALIRHFKPKTVVEFGTRGGSCTHDILHGLLDNKENFIFKPYEISDGLRMLSQFNIDNEFGEGIVKIGGDIMKANDLPNDIEYLFVDNSHDYRTTAWVFEYLLPEKCVDGALVHFHDLVIYDDFKFDVEGDTPKDNEMAYFKESLDAMKFPLEKIFWGWEEGVGSSTWWRYAKK